MIRGIRIKEGHKPRDPDLLALKDKTKESREGRAGVMRGGAQRVGSVSPIPLWVATYR